MIAAVGAMLQPMPGSEGGTFAFPTSRTNNVRDLEYLHFREGG